MSLNNTPNGERLHIGLFGRRNSGKSSLLNAITGQDFAVVSQIKGTTTDPVLKTMELLPIGPVLIIDTPGIDDDGELGEKRVEKTKNVLRKTDVAVLVVDVQVGLMPEDEALINIFEQTDVKYLVVYNKCDLAKRDEGFCVSATTGENIYELKEKIAEMGTEEEKNRRLVGDLLNPHDVVVLVVPIDKAAPKGRLILPQQQAIRDILEAGAVSIVVRDVEFAQTLKSLPNPPKLVITDSQAFEKISKETPQTVSLTSFSILMARYKGVLKDAVVGARALDSLKDGDKVLIAEGCTHHRQCDDIGTVKMPRWIANHTGAKLHYEFTSGVGYPSDFSEYKVIVHCGGCMLNSREMLYRARVAKEADIPMTNYGIAISHMQGILERCIAMLPSLP
ncbi:MAG: [FeFe] hydrogenase H-cluster maturation GTPase HydF [Clostridiales Family XIII bacterium]|jgi:[FeFe] hydrogenase H-cluster maturation GTPase HydF|nr:[FeFe] hydrogenase H-cluster maturation GTPase HydF [Clostridiales Family XIII bacterium]